MGFGLVQSLLQHAPLSPVCIVFWVMRQYVIYLRDRGVGRRLGFLSSWVRDAFIWLGVFQWTRHLGSFTLHVPGTRLFSRNISRATDHLEWLSKNVISWNMHVSLGRRRRSDHVCDVGMRRTTSACICTRATRARLICLPTNAGKPHHSARQVGSHVVKGRLRHSQRSAPGRPGRWGACTPVRAASLQLAWLRSFVPSPTPSSRPHLVFSPFLPVRPSRKPLPPFLHPRALIQARCTAPRCF